MLFIEMIILVPIGMMLCNRYQVDSYMSWIIMAILVSITVALVVIIVNSLIYKKEVKSVVDIVKRNFFKKGDK